VNLSIFAIPHPSQIKDLGGVKIAKTGNIHILYGPGDFFTRAKVSDPAASDLAVYWVPRLRGE
jgi:hypothetical protein